MYKWNFYKAQIEISSSVLGSDISCHTSPDGRKNCIFVWATQHNIPNLCHFDSSEPSENHQDCSDAKKILSEGCFIHHLVTEVETVWSNLVCTAPCSYPTMVGCGCQDKRTMSNHGQVLGPTCQKLADKVWYESRHSFCASFCVCWLVCFLNMKGNKGFQSSISQFICSLWHLICVRIMRMK
jgi:hypothetical protein